ncbi:MAG: phage tail tube protein [Burkholderiaceae bacterium]
MAYSYTDGMRVLACSIFDAPKTITAITNAVDAQISAAAHGNLGGDEFLLESAWGDANNRVFRTGPAPAAGTLNALGLDTSNTTMYSPGGGVPATLKRIATANWKEVPLIKSISSSGGDPKFASIDLLASRQEIKIPTGFTAIENTLDLYWDMQHPNYSWMMNISRSTTPVAFKVFVPGAGSIYGYGYMSVGEQPNFTKGEANTVKAAFTFLGQLSNVPN